MAFLPQVIVDGLVLAGGYILIAAGLALLFGVADYVNVAQGEFAMLGMYGAFFAWAYVGMDPFVSVALTAPVMFLIGLLFYRTMVRPVRSRGHGTHIIMTLGLAFVLQNVALLLWTANVRSISTGYSRTTVELGPASISLAKLLAVVLAIAIMLGLTLFLSKTLTGKAIRAVSQDESLAAAFGVRVDKILALTSGIALALAGAAGSIMMSYLTTFPTIGSRFILFAFAIVIIGGLGSLKGALVAGLVVGLIEAVGQVYVGGLAGRIAVFSLIIAFLYIRPAGLFGKVVL